VSRLLRLGMMWLALLACGLPVQAKEAQGAGMTTGQALPLELNQASRAELESLPGLGIALTARLLDARQQRPFSDWRDLLRRHLGIGPALARKLSDQGLRVQGQNWKPDTVGPPEAAASAASAASNSL